MPFFEATKNTNIAFARQFLAWEIATIQIGLAGATTKRVTKVIAGRDRNQFFL